MSSESSLMKIETTNNITIAACPSCHQPMLPTDWADRLRAELSAALERSQMFKDARDLYFTDWQEEKKRAERAEASATAWNEAATLMKQRAESAEQERDALIKENGKVVLEMAKQYDLLRDRAERRLAAVEAALVDACSALSVIDANPALGNDHVKAQRTYFEGRHAEAITLAQKGGRE